MRKQFTSTTRKLNLSIARLKYRDLKKAACTIYNNIDWRTFFRSQKYHNEGMKSKYLTKNAIQSMWLTKCTLCTCTMKYIPLNRLTSLYLNIEGIYFALSTSARQVILDLKGWVLYICLAYPILNSPPRKLVIKHKVQYCTEADSCFPKLVY